MNFQEFLDIYQKKAVIVYQDISVQTPLVSVCLQTYQHIDYIKQCLDGILMQQTSFSYEILLGDDASTDGTREICMHYAKQHPDKIRLFLHHRENNIAINGNPTGRFNFMYNLYSCRGKYIALCEGDDYWTDFLKLQKQVDFLEKNSDYSMCFHNLKIYNQQNRTFQEDTITRDVNETTNAEDLANGNYIHTPSVVLRNDFKLPSWFSKVTMGDWSLYMLSVNGRKIYKFNEIMGVYRLHEDSIWSKLDQDRRNYLTKSSIEIVLKNLKLEKNIKNILRNRLRKKNKKSLLKKVFLKLKQKFSRFV